MQNNESSRKKTLSLLLLGGGILAIAGGWMFFQKEQNSLMPSHNIEEENQISGSLQNEALHETDEDADHHAQELSEEEEKTAQVQNNPNSSLSSQNPTNAESQSASPKSFARKPAQSPGCYQITFQHKNPKTQFTDHRNLIQLPKDLKLNRKSVCVRVNNVPVKFSLSNSKKSKNQILIGPVHSASDKITASYCTGKSLCKENCQVPKDEFLEAIGGDSGDLFEGTAMAQWDQGEGASKEDAALQKELGNFKKLLTAENKKIFRGWIAGSEVPSCGTQTASK